MAALQRRAGHGGRIFANMLHKNIRHILLLLGVTAGLWGQTPFQIVINGARVMDPESGLDSVRSVGIGGGKIRAISEAPLAGGVTIDGSGLVLSPGFIDLHWHGKDLASGRYQLMDGVTSALELEIGVDDVAKWYEERAGKAYLNYGASIGHVPVRMAVLGDKGAFLPSGPAAHDAASSEQIEAIKQGLEKGMRAGAPAMGFGISYTIGASYWEILEMFRIAAKYNARAHVHIRGASSAAGLSVDLEMGLSEVLAASAITGAALHVVHINSSGQTSTGRFLQMIQEARGRGMDVTTEAYPYTAGATRIESALFDGWMDKLPADYQRLQWGATGERLTRETFLKYRKQGGSVIIHSNTEERVRQAILSPLTAIASDGFDVKEGQGHPRSAGTYSRILAKYVREEKSLALMDALRKMTLMPARILEKRVPAMRDKGRIQIGADADLTLFDAAHIQDKSTYEKAAVMSEGVRYVLIGGEVVVSGGKVVESARAGKPIRAVVQ